MIYGGANMTNEIESRYRVPKRRLLAQLCQLNQAGDYQVCPLDSIHITDRYLDTPDHALRRQGWACRLRSQDGVWSVTLKGPKNIQGAITSREEMEVGLSAPTEDPQRWPEGPLRERVLSLSGELPLQELLTLQQTRRRFLVCQGEREVAQLSLDEVSLPPKKRWHLLECELSAQGELADLQRLDAFWREKYALRPEPRSKLQLAWEHLHGKIPLSAEGAPARPPLRPSEPLSQAARTILRFYAQKLAANEEGTRRGEDPEALHDMRVAARRLRSMLRLLRPFLWSPQYSACEEGLRQLVRALGPVRDLDVALGQLEAHMAQGTPEHATALAPLREHWQALRAEGRQRLLAHLDGPAYAAFKDALRQLVTDLRPFPHHGSQEDPVGQVAPRLIYLHWQMVRAYEPVLAQAPIETLHMLRIECKRLRYALEGFAAVLPKKVVAFIPEVVALQDHLGTMHDAAVAVDMVDAFLQHAPEAAAAGALAYREARRAEMEELYRAFPTAWHRFNGRGAARAQERLLKMLPQDKR